MSTVMENQTKEFIVGEQPRLVIENRAGTIRVRRGEQGVIAITTIEKPGWLGGVPHIDMQQYDGNVVIVRVGYPLGICLGGNVIDFEVRVPDTIDLELSTNAGNVEVQDVVGSVRLSSNAGTIFARRVRLQELSVLQTNAGTIHFEGSLASQLSAQFKTDAGSLDLTLPPQSAFAVDASTIAGDIYTNFPGIRIRHRVPGMVAQGATSNDAQARLHLTAIAGSISIRQGMPE